MKIVIENKKFDYDIGCRLLKLKHKTSPFRELDDIWNDIVPITFGDIAKMENIEDRRIGMLCLGLDRLVSEIKPKLISTETIKKSTTWVTDKGELETIKFKDTYELFEVDGKKLNIDRFSNQNSHYVRFKDTSTDRIYFIWIDLRSVYRANSPNDSIFNFNIEKVNAIQCIAWTIQTNIPMGSIEKILRQGDCILIKPKGEYKELNNARHLTEKEYRTLLVAES